MKETAILKENIIRGKVNIFPDSEQEQKAMLNLSLRIKPNGAKQKVRRFLQGIIGSAQIRKTKLTTNIGTHAKKFKNKTIIEVSNPQTDYKFYTRL